VYHSFVLDCKLAKTEWDGGRGGRKKLKKLKVHIFSMCMTPSHVKLKNAKFSTQNILYGGLMDVSESAKEQTRGTWFHWA
jgi:hypothetical protein